MLRKKITVTGQVQGVGFRPFIYRLATQNNLTGTVGNTADGVVIEVQGSQEAIYAFERELHTELPPLAQIVTCSSQKLPLQSHEQKFQIQKSSGGDKHSVLISPDSATCQKCLNETLDPGSRRFLYPFTNCTNCGPRYTITHSIPYDRKTTSMACFPMCPNCAAEYENPANRRFHAQPNACPDCGPNVWLTDPNGTLLAEKKEALEQTANALVSGKIVAIKGLGGFHLACDATSKAAITTLRQRKKRPHKALAVMVASIDQAKKLAMVTKEEEAMLGGNQRPIVLLRSRNMLPRQLHPDTSRLGLMLAYTPLHHILLHTLAQKGCPALVMTSGNASGTPICLGNREALRRLSKIADLFCLHNRDILVRCDDSVLKIEPDKKTFVRKARGFTPSPVFMGKSGPCVLGVGAHLKNTLCLTKGDHAFVSQHIGDLDNLETQTFFTETETHLRKLLQVRPKAVISDLHPDYMTTRFAKKLGLPHAQLQHHRAHIRAVMAENNLQKTCIGLALDGTGLGDDGTLWGGELLFEDGETVEGKRLGHFYQFPLPGGEQAIYEPWRTALALLRECGLVGNRHFPWSKEYGQAEKIVQTMLDKNLNSPLCSSCGRLFDAVSALLGLCSKRTYEGQAAIVLEHIQDKNETNEYPCPFFEDKEQLVLDIITLFAHVIRDWQKKISPRRISRRFHLGLAAGLTDWAEAAAQKYSVQHIALSGGVFLNESLSHELASRLLQKKLTPLVHRHLPPSDAGISLGQAAYGQLWLQTR